MGFVHFISASGGTSEDPRRTKSAQEDRNKLRLPYLGKLRRKHCQKEDKKSKKKGFTEEIINQMGNLELTGDKEAACDYI